jgi:hypothetical protein
MPFLVFSKSGVLLAVDGSGSQNLTWCLGRGSGAVIMLLCSQHNVLLPASVMEVLAACGSAAPIAAAA